MRRLLFLAVTNIELLLTVTGVLVAMVLTVTVSARDLGPALTFLVWSQGFIIWAVRRQHRRAQIALLTRLRAMLQDRVNNQLTVMLTMAEAGRIFSPRDVEAIERASKAAQVVADELANLSLDSLKSWEERYRHAMPAAPDRPGGRRREDRAAAEGRPGS